MPDNGMLNADFLRRCKRIGYQHPKTILTHWNDPQTWDVRKFENGTGDMLPYWCLSSSEQSRADEIVFAEVGYHEVRLPQTDVGSHDRVVVQMILDNDHVMKPWSHLYPTFSWESVFYFSDPEDAVYFRLCSA